MNKIVASIGMAAVGASAIQTASAQDLGATPNKFWSVTASLRGFYDDNVNNAAEGTDKTESFGLEIAPGLGLAWSSDQTTITAGYRFSAKVYEDKPAGEADKWDKTHDFRLSLDHSFSERYRLGVSDSFVVGQEPDQLRTEGNGSAALQRLSGDNIRNYASVFFNAQLTPLFSAEVGYNNAYFNYDAEFDDSIQSTNNAPVIASNSGLLDRVEHTGYIEGQLQVRPKTQLIAGYQYGVVEYTSDEVIRGIVTPTNTLNAATSEVRNSRSHYGYVGVSHSFRPDLSGSIRGGVQYIDFYNQDETGVSPYVQAVLNYFYAQESSLRLGFTQRRSPIYTANAEDADTSVVFASVTHRITPVLFGSLSGTFQNSTYNSSTDDSLDGESDQLLQLGLNLEYRITRNFSAEVGYNYDQVTSDLANRDYDRNRVYIGMTARY